MKNPHNATLDALTGASAALRHLAGDEMSLAALGLLRERLRLTPQKLMLLFLRDLAPDEIIGETEEGNLRGVSPTTFRKVKGAQEVARVLGRAQ